MELVAVYGTLKKGYRNHMIIQDQEYTGNGTTVDHFDMYSVRGSFPAVVVGKRSNKIEVEVYSVDENGIRSLDCLECNGVLYQREKVGIEFSNGEIKGCWIYLYLRDTDGLTKILNW